MFLLVACLLVLLYTKHVLFAFLVLVVYFFKMKPWVSQLEGVQDKFPPTVSPTDTPTALPSTATGEFTEGDIYNLTVLTRELERLLADGTIDRAFYDETRESIERLLSRILDDLDMVQDGRYRREGREAAWKLLSSHELAPAGPPPWRREARPAEETDTEADRGETLQEVVFITEDFPGPVESRMPVLEFLASAESAGILKKASVAPAPAVSSSESPSTQSPEEKAAQPPAPSTASTGTVKEELRSHASGQGWDETSGYAWQPKAPGALERALHAVSGWPALIVPFLVQNIGWFIGGLCVVAGSVFLVSYTTGFVKALTVSMVLFAYTLFVFWAGYQLRRRRPELEASSNVLLSLGVLLVPLNVAASVRVIADGRDLSGLVIGLVATAFISAGLYFGTMLVSGIMDRSLQGRHPRIFLGLAATQLAVPLLSRFPSWPLLALLHVLLLGLLAFGLILFTRSWLHSIFVEHRKIAYYAAGTFVYATVISFVHLTWGYSSPCAVPRGYYSPFLMALCGLLFYVDAQLKQWTKHHAFLSRLNFSIYGLSVLALSLSVYAPAARLITLILAVGLYAMVLWQYLTLPPLYLLIGCLGWLYGLLILQYLPAAWHMLASLPGIAGLFAASHRLQRRGATAPALVCYRIWLGAAVGLTGWSLLHALPGLPAFGTALTLMVLLFQGLRLAPRSLFSFGGKEETDHPLHPAISPIRPIFPIFPLTLHDAPRLYIVTLAGSVAVAYAPLWTGLSREAQFAFGLVLLAILWAAPALRPGMWRPASQIKAATIEVLLNSALLNLGLCLALAVVFALSGITANRFLPLLLASMGGVLLWLCLRLRERWLFHGALGLWGAAGAIFKLTWFPEPGTGSAVMFLALAVWTLLWWLEREPGEVRALRREQAALAVGGQTPLRLLWRLSASSSRTVEEVLRRPLRQTMVLLWLVGMAQLGAGMIEVRLGWGWTFAAGLGAVVTILTGGLFRLSWPIPSAMLLGLGSWLTAVFQLCGSTVTVAGLSFAGALYAFGGWELGVHIPGHPITQRLAKALHLGADRALAERYVHQAAFAIVMLSIGAPLWQYGLFVPNQVIPLILVTGSMFLWLAGQCYHNRLHSYTLLGVAVLGGILGYLWVPSFSPVFSGFFSFFGFSALSVPPPWNFDSIDGLMMDHGLGLCLVLLGLAMWAIACALKRREREEHEEGQEESGLRLEFDESLYRKPLRVAAVVLTVFAGIREMILAWNDPVSAVALLPIGVLLLAGVGVLLANQALRHITFNMVGILFVVMAGLWVQAALFHSGAAFNLFPEDFHLSDRWLTLSLLGLGLAVLAGNIDRYSRKEDLYALPLRAVASLACGWTLLCALALFAAAPLQESPLLSWCFLTLILCLFPLLKPLPGASAIRGVCIPLLSCPLIIVTLASIGPGLSRWPNCAALIWGYTLWVLGNFVLPRWNERRPQWAVAPDTWPWLGLVAVSFSLAVSSSGGGNSAFEASARLSALSHAGYQAACAVYLLLMLRNSARAGFPWVAALLLNTAGMTFNVVWLEPRQFWFYPELASRALMPSFGCLLGNLLWTNLLLQVVPLWRRHEEALSARWNWHPNDPATPFLIWPSVFFSLWLAQFFVLEAPGMNILSFAPPLAGTSSVLTGILLTLSFLHLRWLHRAQWESHAVLFAVFTTFLTGWLVLFPHPSHLSLFPASWSAMLLAAYSVWEAKGEGAEARPLRQALSLWLIPSLIAAMAASILLPRVPLSERLAALAISMGVAAGLGRQRQQHGWFLAAILMATVLLHGWPLLWIPLPRVALLLPWYALQSALWMWLLLWCGNRLQRHLEKQKEVDAPGTEHHALLGKIVQLLSRAWPAITVLALGEWMLHEIFLILTLAGTNRPQWLAGTGDAAAALGAALLLLLVGLRQARKSPQVFWIYGMAALGGAAGIYIRLLLAGLAPATVWDTAALMGATYVLFILQRFTACKPLLHVVLVLPPLALLTVPLQLASPQAGATLVSAGVLYLLTHQGAGRRPLPLYLSLLAFNAAVYLWIPGWADSSRMLQIYVIPAVVTVLLLLHLHRRELKPAVLNSARLTATSVLYAIATLDVFLRGELAIFALMLALSLIGIIVGIALRTRAFLYTGVTFLVLNIFGQLILLFPEQRLGKAILLLTLGVVITGGMIWFNLQREKILQRIRIFRADLETWT